MDGTFVITGYELITLLVMGGLIYVFIKLIDNYIPKLISKIYVAIKNKKVEKENDTNNV